MRLALKNTLFLLGIYATILFVLAAIVVSQLLVLESKVQRETAQLFAREAAVALTEPSLDRLLHNDATARRDLRRLIEELTKNSQVVTSISVVDRTGTVVASDDRTIGSRVALPEQVFGDSPLMRFITFRSLAFGGGSYELAVPLVQAGERVGYLQIRLQSQRLSEMNREMWDRLLFFAMLGLVCIAGLGFALHVQVARRGRTLTHALEAALRGEAPQASEDLDEFAPALETATRAGEEILRARRRSAQEQHRFVALGRRLNVGVLLLNSKGRAEFASQRALELLNCETEDAVDAVLSRIRPELEQGVRRAPDAEGAWTDVDLEHIHGTRSLRLEFYALDQEAQASHLVLARDRDGMTALERDLRLASQLRGLARLYMSVAHDIRAPLAAIVANLQLLGSGLQADADVPESVRKQREGYLTILDQELHRLRRSLDSLLDHTTLPRENLEEFDLREAVGELEGLLRPQCAKQNVTLETHIPEQPVRIVGSRDALKQAMINLGVNALEAMPKKGRLDIALDAARERATLAFADDGPGISPENISKIFTMHFTTKSGGSGIGLYVARAVVESHGGEIRVDSEPGHGTTFRIDLPAVLQEG